MTKRKHSRMMFRIIAAAMAVAMVSGTAIMTPIADIVGTNITAHARRENIIAQGDYWKITDDDEDGKYKLTIFGTIPDTNGNTDNIPWYGYKDNITEVTTEDGAKTSADARYLFFNLVKVTSMDLSCLDTSATGNMSNMFMYCSSLTSLDVSGLNTSSVTSMVAMFSFCQNLTLLDLSSLDTSSVTNTLSTT